MSEEIGAWFAGRLPGDWTSGGPHVSVDRDEVVVVLPLSEPEGSGEQAHAQAEARAGRIARFREQTRDERIQIAREAEHRFGRKVAWGASCGAQTELFTTIAAPVMTRLRQPERIVLDTLVDAGVARSRSHALAWCVRLVGQHTDDWLTELRSALEEVQRLRENGPNRKAS
jgi:hypothetical protein